MKNFRGLLKLMVPGMVLAFCIYGMSVGMDNLNRGRGEEQLRQVENAVRRAAVSCYATEGAYPDSIEYLEEHYGLQIDRENYTIHYMVFASNLMPDITVLEN